MDIINHSNFPLAFLLGDGPDRHPMLTLILKATFKIPGGRGETAVPAEEQLAVASGDEIYDGQVTSGSVRIETDMVPFKPRADIVLVGKAYAPGGRPVKAVDVLLRVGNTGKVIRVFGDRQWLFPSKLVMVPVISEPQPFAEMPLVYERAFGGIDKNAAKWYPENLAGRGFIGKKSRESVHGKALPNLEDPKNLITSWDSQPRPAGLGFYPRGASPRNKYAGTFDDKWEKERAPEQPLDFSFEFFNAAHPDLQVSGYLRGNEEVELRHLTPAGQALFRLPGMAPKMVIRKYLPGTSGTGAPGSQAVAAQSNSPQPQPPEPQSEKIAPPLDTLVFLPDEGIFYQVWRGTAPLKDLDMEEIHSIEVSVDR